MVNHHASRAVQLAHPCSVLYYAASCTLLRRACLYTVVYDDLSSRVNAARILPTVFGDMHRCAGSWR